MSRRNLALLAVALIAGGCGHAQPVNRATLSPAVRASADNLCARAGLYLTRLAASQRRAHARHDSARNRRILTATGTTLQRLASRLRRIPATNAARRTLLALAQAIAAQGTHIRALPAALARHDQTAIATHKQASDLNAALARTQARKAGLRACGAP